MSRSPLLLILPKHIIIFTKKSISRKRLLRAPPDRNAELFV
nr:MAG TPA: hypothetical protein [Caudoviricetes sp.]